MVVPASPSYRSCTPIATQAHGGQPVQRRGRHARIDCILGTRQRAERRMWSIPKWGTIRERWASWGRQGMEQQGSLREWELSACPCLDCCGDSDSRGHVGRDLAGSLYIAHGCVFRQAPWRRHDCDDICHQTCMERREPHCYRLMRMRTRAAPPRHVGEGTAQNDALWVVWHGVLEATLRLQPVLVPCGPG